MKVLRANLLVNIFERFYTVVLLNVLPNSISLIIHVNFANQFYQIINVNVIIVILINVNAINIHKKI